MGADPAEVLAGTPDEPVWDECDSEALARVNPPETDPRNVVIKAGHLVKGLCRPQCILALDPAESCQCQCGGRYHGRLADHWMPLDPRVPRKPPANANQEELF